MYKTPQTKFCREFGRRIIPGTKLPTQRQRWSRGSKLHSEVRVYAPETIALINAARDDGVADVPTAINRIARGVPKRTLTRIRNEYRMLMEDCAVCYVRQLCAERNVPGRSKMNKRQLVEAYLLAKYTQLSVRLALAPVSG